MHPKSTPPTKKAFRAHRPSCVIPTFCQDCGFLARRKFHFSKGEFSRANFKECNRFYWPDYYEETQGPDGAVYRCLNCSYSVKRRKWSMRSHVMFRHDPRPVFHSCALCPFRTRAKYNLTQHVNNVHNPNPVTFDCHLCPYRAKKRSNLRVHLINVHGRIPQEPVPN